MKIKSNLRDYEVHFADTPDFLRRCDRFPQRCYVVDGNVMELYGHSLLSHIGGQERIVLPVNEERKCIESVQHLYDRLMERSAKRNMTMISIGGGILQDISGFAASTLYRGINWVFVPTTLLAQSDSCIGSKTSLNYKGFKNLIGTFYPPSEVFIYTPFLATQSRQDFFSGLGEVAKLHLMGGAAKTVEFVQQLPQIVAREPAALQGAVRNSLLIKQDYIANDEFDTGRRNLLNFGHCFGHALEATSSFEIPHGCAVVVGMVLANAVARHRGILSADLHSYIAKEVLSPCLAVAPSRAHLNPQAMVEAMKKDKKRTGENLALILLADGYRMSRVNDLTPAEASRAVDEVADLFETNRKN